LCTHAVRLTWCNVCWTVCEDTLPPSSYHGLMDGPSPLRSQNVPLIRMNGLNCFQRSKQRAQFEGNPLNGPSLPRQRKLTAPKAFFVRQKARKFWNMAQLFLVSWQPFASLCHIRPVKYGAGQAAASVDGWCCFPSRLVPGPWERARYGELIVQGC